MDVTIVASIIGAAIVVVGTLIVLNLRSIKGCIGNIGQQATKAESAVENLKAKQAACKVDCERSFVDKELFLRETGFARRSLEKVTTAVDRLDGKLTVIEKLPQIVGDISRSIIKEMNNGDKNGN